MTHSLQVDTVAMVCGRLQSPAVTALPVPPHTPPNLTARGKVMLGVASMRDHMTDEGWQLTHGLGLAGYELCGRGLTVNTSDVRQILDRTNPHTVVVQDKREWDGGTVRKSPHDANERFRFIEALKARSDIFKVTVLKDAQQRPAYHAESASEMGCHAWITYYHPRVVKRVAPYVRENHLIRTYHTVDGTIVPPFSLEGRAGCLLSGAVSGAYPLRTMLVQSVNSLPETTLLPHPGYHRNGSATPGFLQTLSKFKVAVCTASVYGYALRKLIEATACGCVVITNLPSDECLPYIDENLIRVPSTGVKEVGRAIRHALDCYDPERQRHYAELARSRYDYRHETSRLADAIEHMRKTYA